MLIVDVILQEEHEWEVHQMWIIINELEYFLLVLS